MLTIIEDQFVWVGDFTTRHIPKAAGMRWDPEQKRWWTKDESRAVALLAHADEKAKEKLGAAAKAIEASAASDSEIEIPAPAGLTYLPYQRAGIAYAMQRKGSLIGDEMGLGKTIQALGVMNASGESAYPALIVCPAILRLNWKKEAQKWLLRDKVKYCVIEGGAPDHGDCRGGCGHNQLRRFAKTYRSPHRQAMGAPCLR